jgi:amidophosphoribosyltransferase
MCGIVGAITSYRVNQDLYDALSILQHRGQDAAGMMTYDGSRIYLRKANGMVRDAIRQPHMLKLKGNIGLGHVRYPTAGSESASESQPFYVNSPYGISLVHNGNLTNTQALADDLVSNDHRHLNTGSDSEVLLNIFAHELNKHKKLPLTPDSVFATIKDVYARVRGAYSVIVMINNFGLVAFRDPHGIRPLAIGRRSNDNGCSHMVVSESIALDALGYEQLTDVQPGEAVIIRDAGELLRKKCSDDILHAPCLFEYIYLARPDSIMDGVPVYRARWLMGAYLADNILKAHPDHDIDVVIPIPDTSRTCAIPLAHRLGVRYSEGFVKNRYIGRTFIMPGQKVRHSSVKMKLNAIKDEFLGKNVLLVDDSIVRGTTSKEIIQMARDAGAKKVYFASAAPEVRYPNVYGIDMASAKELIAHGKEANEVAELIGANWLIYQDIADIHRAINTARHGEYGEFTHFEESIFTNEYITGDVTTDYLQALETLRGDDMKQKQKALNAGLLDGLHNQD